MAGGEREHLRRQASASTVHVLHAGGHGRLASWTRAEQACLARLAKRLLAAPVAVIATHGPEGLRLGHAEGMAFMPEGEQQTPLLTWCADLAQAARPSTAQATIAIRTQDGRDGSASVLGIPAHDRHGVALGVLVVADGPERRWSAAEMTSLEDLAALATPAEVRAPAGVDDVLQASEERLALALEATGLVLWSWDAATGTSFCSPAYRALLGLPASGEVTLEDWLSRIHPDDRASAKARLDEALRQGGSYQEEFRVLRPDGIRWLAGRGRVFTDRHGRPLRITGVNYDITERKQAAAALEAERALLKAVVDQLPVGVVIAEAPSGRLILSNEQLARTCRQALLPLRDAEGDPVAPVHLAQGGLLAPDAWPLERALRHGEAVHGQEVRIVRGDGSPGTLSVSAAPVRDEEGRTRAAVAVFADITERTQADQQRELLLRELSHRVKNMLALIQAIARQTQEGAVTTEEFVTQFSGRLGALAATHEILTATGWRGASLKDLCQRTLLPHAPGDPGRLQLEVADTPLKPAAAQNLALALHELATNAAKYGALSTPNGRIRLRGAIVPNAAGDRLELSWQETGGPPARPPMRQGFGTKLLVRVIAVQHRGSVNLDWQRSGLRCRISLPMSEVVAHPPQRGV